MHAAAAMYVNRGGREGGGRLVMTRDLQPYRGVLLLLAFALALLALLAFLGLLGFALLSRFGCSFCLHHVLKKPQRTVFKQKASQHNAAQHSVEWPSRRGAAYHSTAQHSTAQHGTALHSTAQRSTAQHNTAQRSTALHSTALHSTAQHIHQEPAKEAAAVLKNAQTLA